MGVLLLCAYVFACTCIDIYLHQGSCAVCKRPTSCRQQGTWGRLMHETATLAVTFTFVRDRCEHVLNQPGFILSSFQISWGRILPKVIKYHHGVLLCVQI